MSIQLEWQIFGSVPARGVGLFGGGRDFGVTFTSVSGGTTAYPIGSAQAIVTIALRALRGLITYPGGLDPQVVYDQTVPFLNPGEEVAIGQEVDQEVATLGTTATTPEPVNPFVPTLPGQAPVGTNPNDPFLPGGSADPGGPINWRRTWPSTQEILDNIRRGGLIVVGGRIVDALPDKWKEAVQFWIGVAIQAIERQIMQGRIDHAQRKALVLRQMELQRWFDLVAQLSATPAHFNQQSVYDLVDKIGIPSTLPTEPTPQKVCCTSCGQKECTCRSDSH